MSSITTDTFQIRAAVATDLPAIEALLTASGLPLDGVAGTIDGFVIAEDSSGIVGTAALERCRENALLRSVAVAPGWRGRGVGGALVERVLLEAERRGTDALYLLTTTAEKYFPTFGFVVIGRDAVPADIRETDEFREACPASATVMMRPSAQRA